MKKGCEKCRQAVLSGKWLPEIGENFPRHTSLHKCEHCDTFWEYTEREAHVIEMDEIKEYYPEIYKKIQV